MILQLLALFVSIGALIFSVRMYRRPARAKRVELVPLLDKGKLYWVPPMPKPSRHCNGEFTEMDALFALDLLDDEADLDFGF